MKYIEKQNKYLVICRKNTKHTPFPMSMYSFNIESKLIFITGFEFLFEFLVLLYNQLSKQKSRFYY